MNSDLDSSLNLYQAFKEYKWYNSYNVPIEIQCGVSRLEVPLDLKISSDDMPQDIYMNAQIICNQIPLHECPISTRFGDLDTSKNMISWDAILTFPVKFRDLSQDALLVLTAWSGDGTVVGGTSLRFFDDNGCLKRGKQKLVFYFNKVGDSNVNRFQNTTPGESYDLYAPWDYSFQMEKHLETFQRNALQSNTDPSSIIKKRTEWLDRLTLQRIKGALSLSNELRDPSSVTIVNNDTFWGQSPEEIDLNHICFLVVELPNYQYPILHEEKHYPSVMVHTPLLHADDIAVGCVTREDNGNLEFTLVGRQFNPQSLCVVADWDLEQENLAEKQYRSLAHDKIRGAADPKIKPNLQEKEKLDRLIQMAADTLSENDKDLLYKFRYALTDNKRALVKLLLSINWNVPSEISELPTLLGLWKEKSPIELSDALKLLGREEAFQNPTVRMYAVDTLHTANDDELLTYLLQLVQALRYEPDNDPSESMTVSRTSLSAGSSAADVTQALKQKALGQSMLMSASARGMNITNKQPVSATGDHLSPLASFLITRACASLPLANALYWFLKVETQDKENGSRFALILESFLTRLRDYSGQEGSQRYKLILAQDAYVGMIIKCQQDAKEVSGAQPIKQAELRKVLTERQMNRINVHGLTAIPDPLRPYIRVTGLNPATARMFKSAVYPCMLEFDVLGGKAGGLSPRGGATGTGTSAGANAAGKSAPSSPRGPQDEEEQALADAHAAGLKELPETMRIMFKSGDDLRQDQLIMQLMQLMDGLLRKVNLDLKLLTYKVMALTQTDGIMEFVPESYAVSAILSEYKTVQNFLKKFNPDPREPYEISAKAMDTFVKSTAVSCVVTYILGIGDRHLDNIMVTKQGQLFHIDFGFIFGQDPKPLPPPFRFTREMADGMGGESSEMYAKFKGYCCQAYNWLRKSANLILNMLSLMGDAGIEDISVRSDLSKVLQKVEEKFRLDLTDEQAEQHFLGLINESLTALAPRVMEVLHRVAVAAR